MFIRINPYLCHLLTRYQSTIFPNHKSCVRKKGVPYDFTFFFPYDIDESKGMLMTFYKKNWPIKTIGTEKLGTLAEEEIGVTFNNHLTFSNTGETVNLMKLCLQSDAILFKYTSKDGEPKSMRFPLAGLAEHYLEQFI